MIIKQGRSRKKYLWLALGAILALASTLSALELTNTTHLLHKKDGPVVTASQQTKGETQTKNSDQQSGSSKSSTDQKSQGGGNAASNLTLLAPSGNFVSNHRPNLSGSPAPNSINSVCTTTPGASCKITFTKDGATKSLPPQIVDQGGSTYWNWKLQDIGLTQGSWKIEAIASLNEQASTSSDVLNLEVGQ